MRQQEYGIVDSLMTEETDEQDFFQFADLELTDEQLTAVKGGPWCSQCAVVYSNHNETTASDNESENNPPVETTNQPEQQPSAPLTDLPIAAAQAAQVSGGVRIGKLLGVN